MPTREELVEALQHATATRARLSTQPGTHGQRAQIMHTIDSILDQLADEEETCSPACSSSASR